MSAAVWSPLAKYHGVAVIALRQSLSERGALLGRMAFYVVILLVFSRLWEVVLERGAVEGLRAPEMLWYLAITEWVLLSVPPVYLSIERDVRNGDIAYRLPRPMSYVGAQLAESLGDMALRWVSLGVTGIAMATLLSGGLPQDPRGLLAALPLGLLASLLVLVFHVTIGLLAFWLQDCSPVYWVWQKLSFTLGGLMLPLEIYPEWLRTIAMWTPFSAVLHGPGRMAFGLDPAFAGEVALRLAVWGALALAGLAFVYRRGLRVLDVNGG